jgi:hypothetical protein
MLKAGDKFHKRDSLAKAVEKHGIYVLRKAKFIEKLNCGYGVGFLSASHDEEAMECSCSYSVYFAKNRKNETT